MLAQQVVQVQVAVTVTIRGEQVIEGGYSPAEGNNGGAASTPSGWVRLVAVVQAAVAVLVERGSAGVGNGGKWWILRNFSFMTVSR